MTEKKHIEYGIVKMGVSVPVNKSDWLNTSYGDWITTVADYIRSLHKVITINGRNPYNPAYRINDIPPAMAAEG